jgi:hypothetical protein
MASECAICGIKLGVFDRVMGGRNLCNNCIEKVKKWREEARKQYSVTLIDMYKGKLSIEEGKKTLENLDIQAKLKEEEKQMFNADAFRDFAQQVLADDILTEVEEKQLLNTAGVLGITNTQLNSDFKDILFRLVIARANDGRLLEVENPDMILKKDEKAHLEITASILKEVAITEYQGGYSGVSFRVAKGIRFNTGRASGRRVVVGHKVIADDTGRLIVTSQRVVFLGRKKSIEMPFSKILSLDVFEDGVRIHLSNIKNAPLFQVINGDVVTATVNTAMKRFLEN